MKCAIVTYNYGEWVIRLVLARKTQHVVTTFSISQIGPIINEWIVNGIVMETK